MARTNYLIESAQKPVGNAKVLGDALNQVYERVTDKATRPEEVTLGTLQIRLSELTGRVAVIVLQSWRKQEVDLAALKELLIVVMTECVRAIEAIDDGTDKESN